MAPTSDSRVRPGATWRRSDGCQHHQKYGGQAPLSQPRETWVNETGRSVEALMTDMDSSMAGRLAHQIGRGRSLLIVAATEVVLFVVANVAYGNGNDRHGPMRTVSNVVWVFFLIGFVVLIVFAIASLAQLVQRRSRRGHK